MKEENKNLIKRILFISCIQGMGFFHGNDYGRKSMKDYYEPMIKGLEMASSRDVYESDKDSMNKSKIGMMHIKII